MSTPDAYTTPIVHHLPTELLALIFAHTLLQISENPTPSNPLPTTFSISHISVRWRTIALSTPKLWSQIHLHWPLPLARLYIARSQPLPVSLYFSDAASAPDSGLDRGLETPVALLASTHVLEHARALHVHVQHTVASLPLLTRIETLLDGGTSLPSLEALTFLVDLSPFLGSSPGSRSTARFGPFVDFGPKLEMLRVSGVAQGLQPHAYASLPRTLTSVSLSSIDIAMWEELPQCLGEIPGLEELELERVGGYVPWPRVGESKVVLDALKRCKIALGERVAVPFMMGVEMPKAESLEYTLLSDEDDVGEENGGEEDAMGRVQYFLSGVRNQLTSVNNFTLDALSLALSPTGGVEIALSGHTHRLNITLPRLPSSDITTLMPLLPFTPSSTSSSSQIAALALRAPLSSNATFAASLVSLPVLAGVRTVTLYAPNSAVWVYNALFGRGKLRIRIHECPLADFEVFKERESGVEIMSLAEGHILSVWGVR